MKSGHPILNCLPFQNHLLVTKKGAFKEKAVWWLAPKSTAEPSGAASFIPTDPCIILKNLPAATFICFESAGSRSPQGSCKGGSRAGMEQVVMTAGERRPQLP